MQLCRRLCGRPAPLRQAIAKDGEDWELWLGLALASKGDASRHALDRAAALNPLAKAIEQLGTQLGVRNSP